MAPHANAHGHPQCLKLTEYQLDQYVEQLTHFIQMHQFWAGPVLALLAFGESLVIVGFFIPATAALLIVGTLIGGGVLPLGTTLAWLILGAIMGDAVSYWLGRYYGTSLIQKPFMRRYRRAVAHGRLFFLRYGFISIFLGRFLGPVRSTIPLVAGMMRMRPRSFQLANIASGVVWVITLLLPGYVVARGAGAAGLMGMEQLLTTITMVIVLSVLGTVVGARVMRMATRRRQTSAAPARPARASSWNSTSGAVPGDTAPKAGQPGRPHP